MQLLGQTVSWGNVAVTATLLVVAQGFYTLYKARARFWALQREHGISTIPHSFLFGHLLVVGKAFAQDAPGAHQQLGIWILLEKHYPELWKQGFYYLDLWPIQYPMLVCYDTDLVSQFTQQKSQPKSIIFKKQFQRLTGGQDLASTEGAHWKFWRSNFNSGFSARNVLSLVPSFIEDVLLFRQQLEDAATSDKLIKLSEPASKLAFDVIGNVVLGRKLNSLSSQDGSFYSIFLKRLRWNYPDWDVQNLSKVFNPARPFFTRMYDRAINQELIPQIDREIKADHQEKGPKTVLNLAIKAFVKQMPEGTPPPKSVSDLGPTFLTDVLAHLRVFLLAGFDTTSYVMCAVFWMLYRNPETLAKVREEHDEVFGSDPALAAQKIRDDPTLLNQLPYTSAVIKEVMRLQPVTGVVRTSEPGFVLTHPTTRQPLPTAGFVLYTCQHAIHRNPALWPQRNDFIPERWLVPEGHELHPVKNAWRPFEMGPRNCIGQELANLELKAVMVLTLRDLDLVPQYDPTGPKLFGDLAYQVPAEVTTRPRDGLPVKIVKRENA